MRLWPFGNKVEERDVQFSPALSVMLANAHLGVQSSAGIGVTADSAVRFMAVWACIRVISEDVASLPLPMYRRLRRGKARAPDHPLYAVLHDSPNPELTSFQWRETLQAHLLLYGNAYSEIVRKNGWPSQLWPIHPSRVSVRRNRETSALEYDISPVMGARVRLPKDRILHIPGLSLDGVTGVSPISVGRDAIGLGMASQEFASGFFARGARPSIILEHPGALSQEAHDRVKADFEEHQTGLSNSQRVALLEEGMKANASLMMPLEDAQFIENRKMSIEEIARLFRVQPHKIGHLERSTFNNIEHLGIDHVVSTIRPWLVRWEQAIAMQLVPEEERAQFFAEFVVDGLLRGDSKGRSDFYKALWEIGVLSPNDIRELENMNPVKDGDTYYVPLNYGAVGEEEEAPAPEIPAENSRNGHRREAVVISRGGMN